MQNALLWEVEAWHNDDALPGEGGNTPQTMSIHEAD